MSDFKATAFIDECVSIYKSGLTGRASRGYPSSLIKRWRALSPLQQDAVYIYIVSTADELIFMGLSREALFFNFCVKIAKVGRLNEPGER